MSDPTTTPATPTDTTPATPAVVPDPAPVVTPAPPATESMGQKLLALMKAKAAALEAQLIADVSTPANRQVFEQHMVALLTELQPFAASINATAGSAVTTAISALTSLEKVESATGL